MLKDVLEQHQTAHAYHDGKRVVARREGDGVRIEVYADRGSGEDAEQEPMEYAESLSYAQAETRFGTDWQPGSSSEDDG